MMINQALELSMVLDSNRFQEVIDDVATTNEASDEKEYTDSSWRQKGMMVRYRASQRKKKVSVRFDLARLLPDAADTEKALHKMEKQIRKYFRGRFRINDFGLTGLALAADINVESQENVDGYLSVLKRVGKVKGFTPASSLAYGTSGLYWKGNSNSTDFSLYDLSQIAQSDKVKGKLKAEVRLLRNSAIRVYTGNGQTVDQIAKTIDLRRDVFMSVFAKIIPFGDFTKKRIAVERIRSGINDVNMRRKMLRLLELIPEKKSVLLGQKTASYRDIRLIMLAFARIYLSPVTISKRQSTRFLENLYEYL